MKKFPKITQFEDLDLISKEYGNTGDQNITSAINQLHQNAIQLAFQMKSLHIFHKNILKKIEKLDKRHPHLAKIKNEFK